MRRLGDNLGNIEIGKIKIIFIISVIFALVSFALADFNDNLNENDLNIFTNSSELVYFHPADNALVIEYGINGYFNDNAEIEFVKDNVNSFSFNGRAMLNNLNGMIRIVLQDENNYEFLVFDSVLMNAGEEVQFTDYCEETCYINSKNIKKILIQIQNASLQFDSANIGDNQGINIAVSGMAEGNSDNFIKEQQNVKIRKINEKNERDGQEWIAGETALSKLNYAEKRKLFYEVDNSGNKIQLETLPNLKGLEYYVYGRFERPVPDNVMIDTSSICNLSGDYNCDGVGEAEPMGGPAFFQPFVFGGDSSGDEDPIGGASGDFLIKNVPAYYWYRGCGPTAASMVIGYWDVRGVLPNLSLSDVSTDNSAAKNMTASYEHYEEYSKPIDDSGPLLTDCSENVSLCLNQVSAHTSNSIADFGRTSRSYNGLTYGSTYFSGMYSSFAGYAGFKGYSPVVSARVWGSFTWSEFKNEMDSGRPAVFLVDSNADGATDHFVSIIGYNNATQKYAAYNTWDYSVHWYDFGPIAVGNSFGIYGADFFNPGVDDIPNVYLSSPENNTSADLGIISFLGNATDDINLANITLYIWNSSNSLVYTNTAVINGLVNSTNLSYNFLQSGRYTWNYLAYDNSSQSNWDVNRTLNVTGEADGTYPLFSNIGFNYSNGSLYVNGIIYTSNATIINSNGTSGIEFNGTNYTSTNISDLFVSNLGQLSAGTYSYYWWAYGNGTSNLYNATQTYFYTVNRADSTSGLNITGTTPIIYPSVTDVEYNENNTGDEDCSYSINMANAGYGAGTITFNYSTSGCTNYTAGSKTKDVVINQNTTYDLSLSGTTSIVYGTVSDFAGSNCPSELTCSLNISNQVYSAGTLSANYSTAGNSNYSAKSSVLTITINKSVPNFEFLANGQTSNLSLIYPQQINISAKSNAGTVSLDKDEEDYLSSNGINVTLGVGSYVFRANVTGNVNYSDVDSNYYNITINKTSSMVYAFLNNSRSNLTIANGTSIYLNATRQTGEGIIELYFNETLINSGDSLSNLTIFSESGLFNITAVCPATQNYSESYETWWVNVTNILLSLYCGDGVCNNGETCSSCSGDCGVCSTPSGGGGGGGGGGGVSSNESSKELNLTKSQNNISENEKSSNVELENEFPASNEVKEKVYSTKLADKEVFIFKIGKENKTEDHKVRISEIKNDSVVLLIFSEPVQIELKIGEEKEVDINSDGRNDIAIKLNGVSSGIVDLEIRELLLKEKSKLLKNIVIFGLIFLIFIMLIIFIAKKFHTHLHLAKHK